MITKETAPCSLVIQGKTYVLNDSNERRLKEILKAKYVPETPVEEWVDGKKVSDCELQDIFV